MMTKNFYLSIKLSLLVLITATQLISFKVYARTTPTDNTVPIVTITANPSASSICTGGNTAFSITATGATTYKWQVNTGSGYADVANGGIYSGATTATLTLTGATGAYNTYLYRGVAINGGASATSTGATLTVNSAAPAFSTHPSGATICPSANTSFTGTATGGAVTYKWQLDNGAGYSDITDGGVYTNTATASLAITAATTSMYGYKYRLGATNTCGTTYSDSAILRFSTTWTGTTSANWNVASNWSCNILPDANTDVVINTAANTPIVNASSTARNISIGVGGVLTMASSVTLSVKGDISNLGTFVSTATGNTVSFNAASAQAIPTNTYYNLAISGAVNKTLAGNVTVSNTLSFSGGTKFVLGNYTLTLGAGGVFSGANSSNYMITNGTGGFKRNNVGSSMLIWPVGTAKNYTPLAITNTGTVDNFTARIIDGIYANYTADIPSGPALIEKAINKTWILTEDVPGGSNATLIVQWNLADTLFGFLKSACNISHFVNGVWQPAASNTTAAGSNPFTQTRTGITSFSPFGVGMSGMVLPLKILSFTGKEITEGISLQWATADEINTAGFEVERSLNGSNFITIGIKASQAVNANYQYADKDVIPGNKYTYRLKMNDKNGNYTYSAIIAVTYAAKPGNGYSVYPNPVKGAHVYVKPLAVGNDVTVHIAIIDMLGKKWYSGNQNVVNITNGRFEIPVKQLPEGSYILQISDKNGIKLQATKFTKFSK